MTLLIKLIPPPPKKKIIIYFFLLNEALLKPRHPVNCFDYFLAPHQYNGLFASRRELSEMEVEGYRVNQVAAILNNLSLDHKAAEFLSSHNGVLSFLLLANNCCLPEVASTAMDVLVSLVPWISLPSPLGFDSLAELLLHCMLESLLSSDRMIILKGTCDPYLIY